MGGGAETTERLLYADGLVRISLRSGPRGPLLVLDGEIDMTNSEALSRTLADCRVRGGQVTVDTSGLTFIDLAGLRALLHVATPEPQRWVRLRNVTPYQRRLLELLGWCYEPDPAG
ncbi:STAS domain-containing protein [Nonomuraea lactucae]|uniref:STAS domain-containing protein n=1 Tax=Nonomuraea lactucae TaxID=2249762 RepID=UPI000DE47048|nr:STAS domain-containing protein [Nonomuraea lactucae]